MTKQFIFAATMVSGLFAGLIGKPRVFSFDPRDANLVYEQGEQHLVPLIAYVTLSENKREVKQVLRLSPLKVEIEKIKRVINFLIAQELSKYVKENVDLSQDDLSQEVKIKKVVYDTLKSVNERVIPLGKDIVVAAYVKGKKVVIPLSKKVLKLLGQAGIKLGEGGVMLKDAIYRWYQNNLSKNKKRAVLKGVKNKNSSPKKRVIINLTGDDIDVGASSENPIILD